MDCPFARLRFSTLSGGQVGVLVEVIEGNTEQGLIKHDDGCVVASREHYSPFMIFVKSTARPVAETGSRGEDVGTLMKG